MQAEALRECFKASLGKLLTLSTRQLAMKQVRSLVTQYKTTSSLRVWLSVLSQKRQKHNESQIYVLAFIIEQYGSSLLDPLDKVPSIEKTVFRVTQLISKYFNDGAVGSVCQKAWVQLYLSTLQGQPAETNKKLLFDSLEAMLLGGADRISQMTAQLVIDGLLEAALARQDHTFFKLISKRTLVLFLKTSIPHWAALTSLQTILAYFGVNNLTPLLEQIVAKTLQQVQNAQKDSVGFRIKTEAANTFSLIGEQIQGEGISIYQQIGTALEDLATDRVWAIQSAGKRAASIWKQNKIRWDEEFIAKQQINSKKQVNQFIPSEKNISKITNQSKKKYNQPQNNQMFYNQQSHPFQQVPSQPYNRPYVTANNFFPQNGPQQKPNTSASNWNPQKDQQKRYLQKYSGVNASNFLQERRPVQTYNQKMEQLKRNVYNPKPEYTQFDETVPWSDVNERSKVEAQRGELAQKSDLSQKSLQQVQRSELLELQNNARLLREWKEVVQLADSSQMEAAVMQLLRMDDDMYMLRFFLLYENALKQINKKTAAGLLKAMLRIRKTSFLDGTLIKLTKETIDSGTLPLLPNGVTAKIRKALDQHHNPKLKNVIEKVKSNFQRALTQ